jgi:hypothetical protein
MNIEIEQITSDIKNIVPTLNVIIENDNSMIFIENKLVFSNQGPMSEKVIICFLCGLQKGIILGVNYEKHK